MLHKRLKEKCFNLIVKVSSDGLLADKVAYSPNTGAITSGIR